MLCAVLRPHYPPTPSSGRTQLNWIHPHMRCCCCYCRGCCRRYANSETDVLLVMMPNKTCANRNMSYDMWVQGGRMVKTVVALTHEEEE